MSLTSKPAAAAPSFQDRVRWRATVRRPSEVQGRYSFFGPRNKAGFNPVSDVGMYIYLVQNLPEFVASPLIFSGFKALWRLFGIVTYRGQGQCPVLNLEEGSDNFADAISL